MRKHLPWALAGLLATAALTGCGSDQSEAGQPASGDTGSSPAPAAEATAASDWLVDQLEGGLVETSYEYPVGSGKYTSATDLGLTLDVFFALEAADEHDDVRSTLLRSLEPRAGEYVGTGKTAYAGATGKLLTAVEEHGGDVGAYAGGRLLPRLERLVQTKAGDEQGRAKDAWDPSDEFGGDYSNTIGQSWVVRALAGADSDLADESAAFLLRQQCTSGAFRLAMESRDFSCDGGTRKESAPSVDATAFAVDALLAAQDAGLAEVEGVSESLDAARAWLLDQQAENGSFADGDGGPANANTTGVAGQALAALGEEDAAARAAAWLADHQVGSDADVPRPLRKETGAVAFDHAALTQATEDGITRGTVYQWQRATAQAVPGLVHLNAGG